MALTAFVFSGQGAQYSGMGRELYESGSAAKSVFDRADIIRPGTSDQCFTASKEELSKTVNTQPCLFCVDLAAALALRERGIIPGAAAGFSLGEIPALTFAGVMSFENGFKLVCKRAEFMHEASSRADGSMVAVLKLTAAKVEDICRRFEKTYPVNYNSAGQTVVALSASIKESFCTAVKEAGGRAVPLSVSGAFHSPFMDEASDGLAGYLENAEVGSPDLPVYANSTARPYSSSADKMKKTIAMQANHPVLWQKTIENMMSDGIDTFIEVGAGKTLFNLIRKISPESRVFHVEDKKSLDGTAVALHA